MTTTPRRRRRRRERFLPYLLLAPALILLAGMLYPFGLGLYYSFTSYWLQYPNRFRFVWLDNYVDLLGEPLFVRALEFTARLHAGGRRGAGGTGARGRALPACAHPRAKRDARADADAAHDTARDHRADVEDHDGVDERRHPELRAFLPRRRSHQLVRLHARSHRLGPHHRYVGQPSFRRPGSPWRAPGASHRAVRGGPGRRRRPHRHAALCHAAALEPVHRARRPLPDNGFAHESST